jgi:Predicted transcriptional regulator
VKVDRLVSIILLLLEKERIGAQELAERFEVSPRTIYRDIDAINMAGIPVLSTPGAGGGFEILPRYKLDKSTFSAADLSALLMGLSNLSGVMRGDELANALAKVRSFIPADRAKEIELRANQVCIDLTPWMGNRNLQPCLKTIKTALQHKKLLSFSYTDLRGEQTARTVEPYQLVLKSSHWYLQGYCRRRSDFRLFKLSRMTNLNMQAETFTPREYEKPRLNSDGRLEAMQTKIKIRIHRSIVERILDYCAYEDLLPDGGEHYIADFPFIENEYYYGILLSFGEKCECLEPRIRDEIKLRAQRIADLYA